MPFSYPKVYSILKMHSFLMHAKLFYARNNSVLAIQIIAAIQLKCPLFQVINSCRAILYHFTIVYDPWTLLKWWKSTIYDIPNSKQSHQWQVSNLICNSLALHVPYSIRFVICGVNGITHPSPNSIVLEELYIFQLDLRPIYLYKVYKNFML